MNKEGDKFKWRSTSARLAGVLEGISRKAICMGMDIFMGNI